MKPHPSDGLLNEFENELEALQRGKKYCERRLLEINAAIPKVEALIEAVKAMRKEEEKNEREEKRSDRN